MDDESGADFGLGCGLLVPRGAARGRAGAGLETLPLLLPWEPVHGERYLNTLERNNDPTLFLANLSLNASVHF